MRLMSLKLRGKITGLSMVAAALPVAMLLILISIQKRSTETLVIAELDQLTRANVVSIAKDMYAFCQIQSESAHIVNRRAE